jgi:dihydrofolate reductase
MRKVTFSCATSLDNYIARENGSFDWIMHSDEAMELMKDFWSGIGTMIMGRKTYDIAQQNAPSSKNPNGQLETFVFSRTLEAGTRDGYTFVNIDPAEFVSGLKQGDGKDIFIMSGGSLARSLLEAGVIDEIGLNIHPILLGSGVPLFYKMKKQTDLEMIDCRSFKNGCVYVKYRVKN